MSLTVALLTSTKESDDAKVEKMFSALGHDEFDQLLSQLENIEMLQVVNNYNPEGDVLNWVADEINDIRSNPEKYMGDIQLINKFLSK